LFFEKSFWLVDLFFPEILHFLSSSLSFRFKDLCESAVWCEESQSHSDQLPWCVWNFCIQHTRAGCGFASSAFPVLPSSCSWSWIVSSNILRLKFLSFNSCHISIYQKTWNSWLNPILCFLDGCISPSQGLCCPWHQAKSHWLEQLNTLKKNSLVEKKDQMISY
jgi:hypothetical protein